MIAKWTLKTWGDVRMKNYMRSLNARFAWLATHPQSGRRRDDIHPGYRSFAEGEHLVFYIIQPDGIAIIGVPHQAMDVGGYFA